MEQMERIERTLGYTFKEKRLLREALTHKSFKQPYNNERLEFLGDAVLDLIVGEYLFEHFPKHDEGKLSKMRASLVNEEGFTRLAKHINLGDAIFLSNAEENNGGRDWTLSKRSRRICSRASTMRSRSTPFSKTTSPRFRS
jgi:ribonuclease-3